MRLGRGFNLQETSKEWPIIQIDEKPKLMPAFHRFEFTRQQQESRHPQR